jgi:hypothetical protein
MSRRKDVDWNIGDTTSLNWDQVKVSLLMDLRDELKKLNALLHCSNFTALPGQIYQIRREVAGLRRDLKAERRNKESKKTGSS